MASTLNAIGATYLFGAPRSTASPSSAIFSMSASAALRICPASSATPATPDPETAWYVETTRRISPAASCSGLSTGIAAIVVQFGLAMMPLGVFAICSPLTSLTMSGTSGSRRHAEELSMTVTPAAANFGASAFDVSPPAEKIATSRPLGSAVAASSRV